MHVQKLTSAEFTHTKRTETQMKNTTSLEFNGIAIFRVEFRRVRFSEMCSPRRAGQGTSKNYENPGNLRLIECPLVYPFAHQNSMKRPPQMHLNSSPTCFEGPRGRKIRFRSSARNLAHPAGTTSLRNTMVLSRCSEVLGAITQPPHPTKVPQTKPCLCVAFPLLLIMFHWWLFGEHPLIELL